MLDYSLILINVLMLVAGQILWKTGMNSIDELNWQGVKDIISSPYIWGGIVIYVVATGVWLVVLFRNKLSVVYPMQSTAYIFMMLAGMYLFGENIPLHSWLGVALIITGVILVSLR